MLQKVVPSPYMDKVLSQFICSILHCFLSLTSINTATDNITLIRKPKSHN